MKTCPSSSVHIPKSRGGWGFSTQGIGVKWLKTQPLVY
ncbi:transposase, partial [Sulfolobus sp. A20-N-F8]